MEEECVKILEVFLVFEFVIVLDIYIMLENDVCLVFMWNFVIVNCDLLVFFVKVVVNVVMFDNDWMVNIYKVVCFMLLENWIKNNVLKWYLGVVEWFKENVGVIIVDDMIYGN